MEMFLMRESERLNISTARFANVAFSDGSLLQGFNNRIIKCSQSLHPRIYAAILSLRKNLENYVFCPVYLVKIETSFPKVK